MRVTPSAKGFTLLELIIVLFIVGLSISLIAPRIGDRIDQTDFDGQLQAVEDQLRTLPRRARLQAQALELPRDLFRPTLGDGLPPLSLPPGWQVTFAQPLLISQLGACSGSQLQITPPHGESTPAALGYEVRQLTCELRQTGP